MGSTWVLPPPDGPHVGSTNLAIRDVNSFISSVEDSRTECATKYVLLRGSQTPIEKKWSMTIVVLGINWCQSMHYSDVIMGTITSQITSLTIVYSTIYSVADQRKHQSSMRVTGLCKGNSPGTGEFPAQRASNAENVSIWWRHHEHFKFLGINYKLLWGHYIFSYSINCPKLLTKDIWEL